MKDKIKIIKKKKGFTLIELLVVISIIGILTIVSASSFRNAQVKSRDSQRKTDLDSISKALMMYYNDTGSFPDLEVYELFGDEDGFIGNNNVIYMRKTPKDPVNTGTYRYVYKFDAATKVFNLFANLENKNDPQCKADPYYSVDGQDYCYGVSSPNAVVTNW